MKPLVCDALWTTQPSKAERILLRIPFLGWPFAAALEQARFRPMVHSIERQLRERPETSGEWPPNPRQQEICSALRRLIKEEFGWPNDHFIPTDPFGIAFWAHQDGLDDVSAVQRMEQEFGLRVPATKWEHLWSNGTLGELLELLVAADRELSTSG